MIKVNRGPYDHYGVYVSDGPHVIHYTSATGPADFNGMVRETSVAEFLNGAERFAVCRFPKNMNEFDAIMRPAAFNSRRSGSASPLREAWEEIKRSKTDGYHLYSGEETVARARGELGKEGYNIVCNNCEHFAVWCKTGLRESSQVNNVLEILITLCEAGKNAIKPA